MNLGGLVAGTALAAALAFVFVAQSRDDGFRRGHRGWVSSHTLAIAEKATAENRFVGHALSVVAKTGRDLAYFDRYPFFFSVLLHEAGSLARPDKAAQIHVARQVMNAVYALTVVALVALLLELGLPFATAVAAAALAASTTILVEYRDMVHYDQPALLGMVLLLRAIAKSERTGRYGSAVGTAAFAVACGRGYASLPLLGLWWLAQSMPSLRNRSIPLSKLRSVLRVPAAAALAAGIGVAATAVAWNIAAEARQRDVAWTETSVVDSAARRLPLRLEGAGDEAAPQPGSRRTGWSRLLFLQTRSLAASVIPWSAGRPLERRRVLTIALALAVAATCFGFAATRPARRRCWLLATIAGPAWIVAVPNLTAFHPYAAMYLLPTSAVFFAALLDRTPAWLSPLAAVAACLVLATSTASREREMSRHARVATLESDDMTAIAARLRPGEKVGALRPPLRGAPFALGFYLPGQDLVVEGPTQLLLSRSAEGRGENLTPANRFVFLLYSERPWTARSPVARLHPESMLAQKKTDKRRRR